VYGRFEYITNLQYRVKSLQYEVDAFRSGSKYVKMRDGFDAMLAEKDHVIKGLEREVVNIRRQMSKECKCWIQAADDIEKECAVKIRKMERRIKETEERALRAERQRDEYRDKLLEKMREYYQVGIELEEEKGRNQKLTAQLNRDFENSSLPSSMTLSRRKIVNNREKTDKKPGGQPGHEGHGRKRHIPTKIVFIHTPKEYADSPDFKSTGRTVTKQMVNLIMSVDVCEYRADEYRNIHTGQRVHAQFPPGVVNDVNYGGSVKAFAFLLNNKCCVSVDKTRRFLSDLTDGVLNISNGMINGLSKEFAKNTIAEQDKAFADLLLTPVMNTDCTNARIGGRSAYVYVCATPTNVMYFAREHKGHQGVKDTPVEDYQGILVHDHDRTFYNYGTGHQECLTHALRYLKDSIENEPGLTWNSQMRGLLQEIIHYVHGLDEGDDPDPDVVAVFESRYDEILDTAKDEYEYEPPSAYYKDGYNLSVRLGEYMKNHLLFLHDMRVPSDNNLAERLLRVYKRKQKQVMTMRSFYNLEYLCRCMGVLASLSAKSQNLYKSVSAIYD
jgi:hypothetical protein